MYPLPVFVCVTGLRNRVVVDMYWSIWSLPFTSICVFHWVEKQSSCGHVLEHLESSLYQYLCVSLD